MECSGQISLKFDATGYVKGRWETITLLPIELLQITKFMVLEYGKFT